MRKIIFEKVGMKNFGPYIDPLEFKIKDGVLTLITGPNGIGKTMSLDAFSYTLYGITSKGARGDDVVNNIIGKNCHTWVNFKDDNDTYSVNRYHKHSKFRNTVLLSKNGEEPYKKGQKEVLPEIERLILPRQLFMNTIMFAQKVKDFFTDLGDADKKEIFRKVLRLEDYVLYYNSAKAKLDLMNEKITESKNQIAVKLSLKEEAKFQIEDQKLLAKEFVKNQKDQVIEFKKKQQANNMILNKWKETIKELKDNDLNMESILTEIATTTNELKNIGSALDTKKQKINSEALQKESEIKDEANKLQTQIVDDFKKMVAYLQQGKDKEEKKLTEKHLLLIDSRSKNREDLLTLKGKETVLNESIDEMADSVLSAKLTICPTCEQKITEETRGLLLKKRELLISQKAKIVNDLGSKYEKEKEISKQLEDFLKQSGESSKQLDIKIEECNLDEEKKKNECQNKLNNSIAQIQEIVKRLEEELKQKFADKRIDLEIELKKLKANKLGIEIIKDDISNQEKMINNLQNDIAQVDRDIDRIQKSEFDTTILNSTRQRIVDLDRQLNIINNGTFELEKLHKIISFWKEGFSSRGIPSMLIDDSIPFMNERVSYYLEKISNGRYIVSFDTLDETKSGEFRDKISVKVVDTETKANKRVQLSGGQTRLIDIATILTLGDLQSNVQEVSFNILLFDEIFDSLDDTNVEFVSKVLRILTNDRSVFVISHKHVDQLEADDVYNFS
jgi:DNA repair exonuclease SbcCD ATPase subunit